MNRPQCRNASAQQAKQPDSVYQEQAGERKNPDGNQDLERCTSAMGRVTGATACQRREPCTVTHTGARPSHQETSFLHAHRRPSREKTKLKKSAVGGFVHLHKVRRLPHVTSHAGLACRKSRVRVLANKCRNSSAAMDSRTSGKQANLFHSSRDDDRLEGVTF